MSYSVAELKKSLGAIFHGTNLDQVQGLNDVIERAANQLIMDIDPQETKRTVPFATPLFNSVYDYACPPDLKGNRVIDIKAQVNRMPYDLVPQYYERDFDRNKSLQSEMFTIQYNNFIRTIRVNMPQLQSGMTIGAAADENTLPELITSPDDSWRLIVVGPNLVVQKKIAGVWTDINTYTP